MFPLSEATPDPVPLSPVAGNPRRLATNGDGLHGGSGSIECISLDETWTVDVLEPCKPQAYGA